jgi:mannose-1-phosphate guanylyltransferase
MDYAVIMAGGMGKRLWPLSRAETPKQLLPLVEGKCLLQIAAERLLGIFEPENIFVVTNAAYADAAAAVLDSIPRANVIGEPEGRDTAAAIALAAEVIAGRDEKGTMAVFTADHIIRPQQCFAKAVTIALQAAKVNENTIVTFGVKPSWPHTGLGYIQVESDEVSEDTHKVLRFKEKPDHTTARRYVESGEYFWNSGMFVWTVATIRRAMQQHLPATFEKLQPIHQAVADGQDPRPLLAEIYPTLEKISIDYAVMEKAESVMMVELKCEWIDLGSWPALEDVIPPDQQGNSILAPHHVIMDSFRNVIVSRDDDDHLLAILGVDDCIVIHSPDATLICRKSDDQRLKELVAAIEKHHGGKFL